MTNIELTRRQPSRPIIGASSARTVALVSGLLSSMLYAAMLLWVPLGWEDYSSASQTVSELAAIDAPTRQVWITLAFVWTVLYALFGWAVWKCAGRNRTLRVVGGVIVIAAALGLFWPPMHQREVLAAGGATWTDTLHLVWTIVNGLLTLVAMGFGAAALGHGFRLYSILTMAVVVAAGTWTGTYASAIQSNLPTPAAGIWERIDIGAWLLWVMVLAVVLVRQRPVIGAAGTSTRRPVMAVTRHNGLMEP